MKRFNVTGPCIPHKHYMADISGKIAEIKALIDRECYFTINRARQYGKTTTLFMLEKSLPADYTCISISFEGVGETMFESPEAFCQRFLAQISIELENADRDFAAIWRDETVKDFDLLGRHLNKLCKDRKIVLLIDEVDKTSNNQVFLHFLGMLRSKYIARERGNTFTFHSVILAGVYDVKNIKLKMINEGAYTQAPGEGKIYNSPWNIAVDFDVDMSLNPAEISAMLKDYEADYKTGMDIAAVSEEIYKYTSGYPFLVSRICQYIDEKLGKDWTGGGLQTALNAILKEQNLLFDDLAKNLENNKELYDFLYSLLIVGERKSFNLLHPVVRLSAMYGYIKRGNGNADALTIGYVAVSNIIFESVISNYFIAKDENVHRIESAVSGSLYQSIVKDGRFDMELCLRKFAEHYAEIYSEKDKEFLERNGRLVFLSYLKPLINGRGFYHIESQFTDMRRMDIIVDFGCDQFIIELKIWHGDKYKQEAYAQLLDYMNSRNAGTGYLLTFDFRKNTGKRTQTGWVEIEGKKIFDVVV